jgi:hypothetical protein
MFYAQFSEFANSDGTPSADIVEVEIVAKNPTRPDRTIVQYPGPMGFCTDVFTRELFGTREAAAERLIERVESFRSEKKRRLDAVIEKIRSKHLPDPAVVG